MTSLGTKQQPAAAASYHGRDLTTQHHEYQVKGWSVSRVRGSVHPQRHSKRVLMNQLLFNAQFNLTLRQIWVYVVALHNLLTRQQCDCCSVIIILETRHPRLKIAGHALRPCVLFSPRGSLPWAANIWPRDEEPRAMKQALPPVPLPMPFLGERLKVEPTLSNEFGRRGYGQRSHSVM